MNKSRQHKTQECENWCCEHNGKSLDEALIISATSLGILEKRPCVKDYNYTTTSLGIVKKTLSIKHLSSEFTQLEVSKNNNNILVGFEEGSFQRELLTTACSGASKGAFIYQGLFMLRRVEGGIFRVKLPMRLKEESLQSELMIPWHLGKLQGREGSARSHLTTSLWKSHS